MRNEVAKLVRKSNNHPKTFKKFRGLRCQRRRARGRGARPSGIYGMCVLVEDLVEVAAERVGEDGADGDGGVEGFGDCEG